MKRRYWNPRTKRWVQPVWSYRVWKEGEPLRENLEKQDKYATLGLLCFMCVAACFLLFK